NIEHSIGADGAPIDLEVTYPPGIRFDTTQRRAEVRDFVLKAVVEMATKAFGFGNFEAHMKYLVQEEDVLDRAFGFTETSVAAWNILGNNPKRGISDWGDFSNAAETPLSRTVPWDTSLPSETESENEAASN